MARILRTCTPDGICLFNPYPSVLPHTGREDHGNPPTAYPGAKHESQPAKINRASTVGLNAEAAVAPLPVSGIANSTVSVATRNVPLIDMPTPPPITTPSHRERRACLQKKRKPVAKQRGKLTP